MGHTETFKQWLENHNKLPSIEKIYPHDILERAYDADILCGCLQTFLYQKLGGQMDHHIHLEQYISNFVWAAEVQ